MSKKSWSEEQLQFIHKNYLRMSDEEMALEVGHSAAEIRKIRRAVGWGKTKREEAVIEGLRERGPLFTVEVRKLLVDSGIRPPNAGGVLPKAVAVHNTLIPRVGARHRFIYYLEGQEEEAVERILAARPKKFKQKGYWRKRLLQILKEKRGSP